MSESGKTGNKEKRVPKRSKSIEKQEAMKKKQPFYFDSYYPCLYRDMVHRVSSQDAQNAECTPVGQSARSTAFEISIIFRPW